MRSFSKGVKSEIIKVRIRNSFDEKSIISGFTLANASLNYDSKIRSWTIRYVSESNAAIEYVAALIKRNYVLEERIFITEHERLHAKNCELMVFGDELSNFMRDSGFMTVGDDGDDTFVPAIPDYISDGNLQKAFMRGVFLACGSVSDPEKGCHAELVLHNDRLAEAILTMLQQFGIHARTTNRKNTFVIYVKDGESVEDFLVYLGAIDAKLAVGDARMIREVSNETNRGVNCITANIEKAARTSARQIDSINIVKLKKGLDSLNPQLYAVAEARLNNPEMNLSELAELLGIGKSAVNYRLNKLDAIADEIRSEN